jgi:Tfp pilus assembly protein PilF
MLDVSLYGLNPIGHHFTSALLHSLNAALLFLALRSLTGSRWRSLAVAVLFAIHPLRVESVAWIAERKDVLCGTFFFLMLLAYVAYVRRPNVWRYLLVLLLLALGLMSKTMLVTAPPLLLLLDYWPLQRFRRDRRTIVRLILEKVPMLALVAIASAWTIALQGAGGATEITSELTFGQRAANAAASVWRYIGKIILPLDLSPYYPHPGSWPTTLVVACVTATALVTGITIYFARRLPYLLVGWLWFLGMLFPVSGILVQAGRQAMADRYTYLPGIGLTLAAIWGVAHLLQRKSAMLRPAALAGGVLMIVLSVRTVFQQQLWQNDLDLFSYALAVDPDNGFAHEVVGRAFRRENHPDLAIEHYRKTLVAEPHNTPVRLELATLLLMRGENHQAAVELEELVRRKPQSAEMRLGFARALTADKQFPAADVQFAEAARRSPQNADIHAQWALALARQGRRSEAEAQIATALRLDSTNSVAKAAQATLDKSR